MNKPTAKTDPIRLEIDTAGIATLSIDVAGKSMNVIDQTFISCLQQLVGTVATDERIKGVIITSGKPDFVAGADLKWLLRDMGRKLPVAELYASNTTLTGVLRRLESCGKPVVAAIRGTALGGGLEIALACHRRIAARSPKARIGLPEVTVGLLPGAGGTQRLPRAVGKAKAMDLVLTGRMMSADEAERAGLVSRVVSAETLVDEALAAAATICEYSLPVVMMAKEAVNRAYEGTLADGIHFERRMFHSLFATEDQKIGMQAFLDKVKPQFKQR